MKKVRSKNRRDVAYIKKNMNRKFKRTMREIEDQAIFELNRQEENHKKAVNKITKNWSAEKHHLEERNSSLEQENGFIRRELEEYKASHDNQIKEMERLKKIIDQLEDENDSFKDHIAEQINYETLKRENQCEE